MIHSSFGPLLVDFKHELLILEPKQLISITVPNSSWINAVTSLMDSINVLQLFQRIKESHG